MPTVAGPTETHLLVDWLDDNLYLPVCTVCKRGWLHYILLLTHLAPRLPKQKYEIKRRRLPTKHQPSLTYLSDLQFYVFVGPFHCLPRTVARLDREALQINSKLHRSLLHLLSSRSNKGPSKIQDAKNIIIIIIKIAHEYKIILQRLLHFFTF